MTAKDIFLKIKAAFDGTAPAPAIAEPVAAAVTTAKTHKLQDGTEISISQAGDLPATGDLVTIGGLPATAGTYTLEDGSVVVVDATGMITAYTPATLMSAPVPPTPAVPAPAQPVTLSTEEPQAAEEKFATLEAFEAYKETASLQFNKLEESSKIITEQAAKIAKHEETIKGLFELVEKLVELPTADPVTLTESQKAKFERNNLKDERLKKFAEAMKKNKALA